MLENLGTLLFVLMAQIFYVILLFIMAIIPHEKTKLWARKRLDRILFNEILMITDGIFLVIVMNSAINI